MIVCLVGKSHLKTEIEFMGNEILKLDNDIVSCYIEDTKKENIEIIKHKIEMCDSSIFIFDNPNDIITNFYIGLMFGIGKNFKIVSSASVKKLMNSIKNGENKK